MTFDVGESDVMDAAVPKLNGSERVAPRGAARGPGEVQITSTTSTFRALLARIDAEADRILDPQHH